MHSIWGEEFVIAFVIFGRRDNRPNKLYFLSTNYLSIIFLQANLIQLGGIIIDSKSGVSGAG